MFKQLPRTALVAALIVVVVFAYVVGIQARQAAGQKNAPAAGVRRRWTRSTRSASWTRRPTSAS